MKKYRMIFAGARAFPLPQHKHTHTHPHILMFTLLRCYGVEIIITMRDTSAVASASCWATVLSTKWEKVFFFVGVQFLVVSFESIRQRPKITFIFYLHAKHRMSLTLTLFWSVDKVHTHILPRECHVFVCVGTGGLAIFVVYANEVEMSLLWCLWC